MRRLLTRFAQPILALGVAACASSRGPSAMPDVYDNSSRSGAYDLIIENGRIVDGTGNAWFYGDVAVANGRIARIAPRGVLKSSTARERVDGSGMVGSPVLIDIQA